jgi:hypothetical protein
MAWILNPLTIYGTVAAALMGCLALFFAVKAEICAVQQRFEKSANEAAARLQENELAMQRLRKAMTEAGEQQPAPLPGLNLTRRAQAVRMHQRGEPTATIAAALRAPRNEIELLIRVQEMQQYRVS